MAATVTSTSSVASGTSGTITIPLPGGSSLNNGTWLVAFCASRGNATFTPPAGWTAVTDGVTTLADNDSTIISGKAFQRFDDGSLGSSQAFTTTGTTGNMGLMLRVTGAHPTTPINKTNKNTSAGTADGAPVAASATSTVSSLVLLFETVSNYTTATAPSGYAEEVDARDNTGTANLQVGAYSFQQGAAGATSAQTITTAGAPAGRWVAFTLAVAPSSGGGGTGGGSSAAITTVPNKDAGDGITEVNWDSHIKDNVNSGVVTQIACRVYNSGDLTTSSTTTLTFDTERFDNDTMHSTVSNQSRITINKGGVYLIGGHVQWTADTGRFSLGIRLNGTDEIAWNRRMGLDGSVTTRQSLMTLWNASATDYFELLVVSENNVSVLAIPNTSPEFWAVRL